MYRETPENTSSDLALSGVKSHIEIDPELPGGITYGSGTMDRPRGTVERGDEAVAGGLDLLSSEPANLAPNSAIMLVEQRSPPLVTQGEGPFGGPDDVGEQNRREDAFDLHLGALAGQEFRKSRRVLPRCGRPSRSPGQRARPASLR